MYHLHFNTIASTQIYLKDNLEALEHKDRDILISSGEQTEGIGRRGNTWETFPNSLSMSFTLKPHNTPTMTPIEVGIIAVKFFKKKFNKELKLKWPNDILTIDGKKCGGIICQYVDGSMVVTGLGINLGKFQIPENNNFRHGLGSVDRNLELKNEDQKLLSKELYLEILSTRIPDVVELKKRFLEYCSHINKEVFIFDDGKDHLGIFRGIGDNGEALVEIDSTIQIFFSSSLTILD